MAGWQTKLDVSDRGRVITSRWIKIKKTIRKGFYKGIVIPLYRQGGEEVFRDP